MDIGSELIQLIELVQLYREYFQLIELIQLIELTVYSAMAISRRFFMARILVCLENHI